MLGVAYTIKIGRETSSLKYMEKRTEILSQLLLARISCDELLKYNDQYLNSAPSDKTNTMRLAEIMKENVVLINDILKYVNKEIENIDNIDIRSIKANIELEKVNAKVNEIKVQLNHIKNGAVNLNDHMSRKSNELG